MIINPYRFAAAGAVTLPEPIHWWNLNNVVAVDSGDGLYDLGTKRVNSFWDLTNVSCTTDATGGLNSQSVVDMPSTGYLHRTSNKEWDGDNAGSISVSTWVEMDLMADGGTVARFFVAWRGTTYGVNPWIFDMELRHVASNPNNIWFTNLDVDDDFRRAIDSTTAPTTSVWYHIVGTYASGVSKIYVDGVLTATDNTGGAMGDFDTSLLPFALGTAPYDKGTLGHDGRMGATGIWDVELSATEVSTLYGSGTTDGYYADYTFV